MTTTTTDESNIANPWDEALAEELCDQYSELQVISACLSDPVPGLEPCATVWLTVEHPTTGLIYSVDVKLDGNFELNET
jgi:hypothetical protein